MKIRFRITGFSQFGTVGQNPTEILVNQLKKDVFNQKSSLNQHENEPSSRTHSLVASAFHPSFDNDIVFESIKTVEVSAVGVKTYFSGLQQTSAFEDSFLVELHLGLHGKATKIHLEQWAYNKSDFSIPDVRQLTLKNQPIIENKALLTTQVPVKPIHEKMTNMGRVSRVPCQKLSTYLNSLGHDTVCTNDPGSYLCNYIYYTSLHSDIINNYTTLHPLSDSPRQDIIDTAIDTILPTKKDIHGVTFTEGGDSMQYDLDTKEFSDAALTHGLTNLTFPLRSNVDKTSLFIHVPLFTQQTEHQQYATLCDTINAIAVCVKNSVIKDSGSTAESHSYTIGGEDQQVSKKLVLLPNYGPALAYPIDTTLTHEDLHKHLIAPRSSKESDSIFGSSDKIQ